jgi:hypothetical protein
MRATCHAHFILLDLLLYIFHAYKNTLCYWRYTLWDPRQLNRYIDWGKRLIFASSRPTLGPTWAPIQWVLGALLPVSRSKSSQSTSKTWLTNTAVYLVPPFPGPKSEETKRRWTSSRLHGTATRREYSSHSPLQEIRNQQNLILHVYAIVYRPV